MEYPNPDILVSPHWLMEHKDDSDLLIVDCPWDSGSYARAHIPGALCRPGHAYVKAVDGEGNQSWFLPTQSEFEKLTVDLGIGANSTVVMYDEWGTIFATRLWWVLKYFGFDNAKVLDGGWQGWVSAGLPVSYTSQSPSNPAEPFVPSPNPRRLATLDELLAKYNDTGWQVLDVRSGDEYHGRADHGNKRVGHVPGATHLEWNLLLENSTDAEAVRCFRSADEIQEIFNKFGVDKTAAIVTHCQAAVRATFMAFALELLGYPVPRVYDGSMDEWANLDDTPLE
ncbi:MAG: sulfurtransferase [Candidatus Dadabacteria bacterium]|nr:sulfurtransferase [Candidatus Dadabacteria bacterium]